MATLHPSRASAGAALPLPWKVGELAARTGLSVRALHHYDAIGLLAPSLRTPVGHRLYARADVERLQQVQSLRALGLSLDDIRRLLDPTGPGAGVDPRRVVALQLERLRARIAAESRLADRLEALGRHLDAAEASSTDDLCRLITETTQMEQFDNYFTPEQVQAVARRREAMTPERAAEIRAAWAEIIPAVRTAMARGDDPASPAVQALAARWQALVAEQTAGDPDIARRARAMYEAAGPALAEKLGDVPTPEMFAYVGRAQQAARA